MDLKKEMLEQQKNEITEHHIYKKLAKSLKPHNKKVMERISQTELKHYNFWKQRTKQDIKPDMLAVWFYYIISKILGVTFGIKLMEKCEKSAQEFYKNISKKMPGAKKLIKDEKQHEKELIKLLKEERMDYAGSIVLGLNDGIVELTGALAGFTLALAQPLLIGVAGLITGTAGAMSMGASEYLSTKTEKTGKDPLVAALYTGFAYFFAIVLLCFPYLLGINVYYALGSTLAIAALLIAAFTFYVSVAQDLSFKKRFGEMFGLSMGIATISFVLGYILRALFGV